MEVREPNSFKIKSWSPDDRPREKLLLKGTASLSDAELIAILLRAGNSTMSAVDLAKRILKDADNDLHELARMSIKDLMGMKGMGKAKATSIIAALELGRRRKALDPDEKPKINGSKDIFELLRPNLLDIAHEEFWVVMVNRASRVIKKQQVGQGGVAGTVADPKVIFKVALESLATGIILAHNHPSGNTTPSQQDVDLTRKLREGGKLLDIQILDHIIIARQKYFSFADEGVL